MRLSTLKKEAIPGKREKKKLREGLKRRWDTREGRDNKI